MSIRKTNRAKIDKYLKGKLDSHAMHELERAAQSDPFLMDALDGFDTAATDQDINLADLQNRLAQRVTPKKDRVVLLWRVLPIAASLLLIIGGGYWFFKPDSPKPQYANVIEPKKVEKKPDTATQLVGEQTKISASTPAIKPTPGIRKMVPNYIAKNPVKQNAVISKIPKSTDTTETINLIAQNQPAVKARLNGKDYSGGNVKEAIKALPADILEKIQSTDDNGALAKKSGIATNKYTLSGKITDAATGEPLTGTTVGTPDKGLTQADINGKYSVVVDSGAVYTFNIVGYTPQSIKLKPGQKTLDIHLTPSTNSLAETVIRGYVKRTREETTGSSYIITGKEVQNVPVGNVEQLLQGKVPGLNIQNNKGKPSVYGKADNRAAASASLPDSAIALRTNHLKTITGQVTDKNGLPIPDVMVGTMGKGLAHTDANGKYRVVIDTASTLVFNQVGYEVQFVKLKQGQAALNVNLKNSENRLAEVNIRGYVKRTREETTGSSYIITGKEVRDVPSIERMPIGKIPGKFLPINPPAPKNKVGVKCNENAAFKDQFFSDIAIVEKYMLEKEEGPAGTVTYSQYFDALKFIAKRAPVTIKPNKKTQAAYADIKAFRSDRDKWLEWYENNKCKGLK